MRSKSVLEEAGVSDAVVKHWKKHGLKITYPMKQRQQFFASDDGRIFVENEDKFVPPLSKKETRQYIEKPEKFREDFLKNARFYIKFCNFLQQASKKLRGSSKKKITGLLSLLYLFQRAMDHHYMHWDRYLVYQEYASTPTGFWWQKLKKAYTKATGEAVPKKPPEQFLLLLARDPKTISQLKQKLSKKDFLQLLAAMRAITIFETSQEAEVRLIIDKRTKENILFKTSGEILTKLRRELEKSPAAAKPTILKTLKLHPIIATRRALIPKTLHCFDAAIFKEFRREIARWE